MTASQDEILGICETTSWVYQATECGNGVLAVEKNESTDACTFESLRDRGWYIAAVIPNDGGSYHVLMPWGNPFSEGPA